MKIRREDAIQIVRSLFGAIQRRRARRRHAKTCTDPRCPICYPLTEKPTDQE